MQTIPKTVLLRCIASCLETSDHYIGKGDRPSADWWHRRADTYAEWLATCQLSPLRKADGRWSRLGSSRCGRRRGVPEIGPANCKTRKPRV
jgi:hypothetical protein